MSKKPKPNDECPCGSGAKYKKCHGSPANAKVPTFVPDPAATEFFQGPSLTPGCYDDPRFVAMEQTNPCVLEDYARFVLARKQSQEEQQTVRRAVNLVTSSISATAKPEELHRRCSFVANAVIRMLDALGVWSFGIRGSVSFEFAPALKLKPQYFWTVDVADTPGGFNGHAWVVAPPFYIIDCTSNSQEWQRGEGKHLPPFIASEVAEARSSLDGLQGRFPISLARAKALEGLRSWLPTRCVRTEAATINYQPDGVTMPAEPLERFHLNIGGVHVADFFKATAQAAWNK